MALISMYAQASDPGSVGAGYIWVNTTTGDFQARNTANSAWVVIFNINTVNGGLLPLSGGAMTGAITGSHGLAALADPALTGTPTIDADEIATKDWVTELLTGYQEKG